MWRMGLAGVVLFACGHAVTEMPAPSSRADAPVETNRTAPSVGPPPTAGSGTHVALYGDVRDGRPLAMNHNLVIPNDLKPIAGATVSIPALGLAATTDARGTFDIDLGEVVSDCATDVVVNAAGFG